MPQKRPVSSLRIHHVVSSLTVGGVDSLMRSWTPLQVQAGHRVAVHAVLAIGPTAEVLRAKGVAVYHQRGRHPVITLLKLFRSFRRLKPHVVHCHNYPSAVLGIPAARLARVPCMVITRHRTVLEQPAYRERRFWRAARLCDRIVVVSRRAAQVFAASPWALPEKLVVILNGAPPPPMGSPHTPIPSRSGSLQLISVARLDPVKDFPNLLRAFQLALREHPQLHLWIVGDGPEKPRLLDLIQELRLSNHVELLGYRDDVGRWLAQADLFVLASTAEAFGLAIVEAFAMGVPAVVTDAGGMPEVVHCCGAGLVVPPGRPEALAAAILQLAADPLRRQSLAERARICYARHFTLERMAAQYEELYLGILESKCVPAPLG